MSGWKAQVKLALAGTSAAGIASSFGMNSGIEISPSPCWMRSVDFRPPYTGIGLVVRYTPGPTFSSGSTTLPPPCQPVTFMNSGSFDGVALGRGGWWRPRALGPAVHVLQRHLCALRTAVGQGQAQPITATSASPQTSAARRSADTSRRPSSRLISAPLRPTSARPMKPPIDAAAPRRR